MPNLINESLSKVVVTILKQESTIKLSQTSLPSKVITLLGRIESILKFGLKPFLVQRYFSLYDIVHFKALTVLFSYLEITTAVIEQCGGPKKSPHTSI